MLHIDDNDELKAVVLAMKASDRTIKSEINKATRATIGPVWKKTVESQLVGRSGFTTMLLKGVSISAGNPPSARAATSTRRVGRKGGNLSPAQNYYLAEFGVDRKHEATYQRRSKTGASYPVRRRTNTGLPSRIRDGRVIYPAFAEIAPRAVSLWVQLIIRTYAEAAEGKG